MHELSLIQSLISSIEESAVENGIKRVTLVKLVVGEGYGALPEALSFAFQVLTADTVCAGALLENEERPFRLKCQQCQQYFLWREHGRCCPGCGCSEADIAGGWELYIDFYEDEEADF